MRMTDADAADFSADEFRNAIRFAMRMATPGLVEQRTTFRWAPVRTYSKADPAGVPYKFDTGPTETLIIEDLQLTVATVPGEPGRTGSTVAAPVSAGTPIGQFDESKLTVILLDEEWAKMMEHSNDQLPDEIIAGETTYIDVKEGLPLALFDVDVRTLYATAPDTA